MQQEQPPPSPPTPSRQQRRRRPPLPSPPQQQQQHRGHEQAQPAQDEGGTLLFLTNLLIGALLSWGLLSASRYFDFGGYSPPTQSDAGGHAVLGKDAASSSSSSSPTHSGASDERSAAAARFLIDRWAHQERDLDRGRAGGQLQRRGGQQGDDETAYYAGKGVGIYQPQQSPQSLLRSGQLIQERYVLQDFIQNLGQCMFICEFAAKSHS